MLRGFLDAIVPELNCIHWFPPASLHSFPPVFSGLSSLDRLNRAHLTNFQSNTQVLNFRFNSMAVAFGGITPSVSYASSSKPQMQPPYDVFINHRGLDVKLTLGSTIYHVLDILGVKAFLDVEIELGDRIPQTIEDAMRSARIHIAILSQDYVSSPWCLAELAFMHENTQAPIVPVFYEVDPAEFRWRLDEEPYVGIFSKHKERYPGRADAWKPVLHKIADTKGIIVKGRGDDDGIRLEDDEGIRLKEIVNRVRGELIKVNAPFDEPEHLVGLGRDIKFLESAQVHESVNIVGILGMSGCGKTTLPESSRKLLWELVHPRDMSPLAHGSELKPILAGRFKALSAPVLIVLDDVDRLDQLDALLPEKGRNLGPGSLIIVTTRDRSVLEPWGIFIHKMTGLDPCHAKELFGWHAFLDRIPTEDFEGLVQQFIKACDGLPLFIEVIARMLYRKSKNEWRSKLSEISGLSTNGVQRLKSIIYETLEDKEKYIFLDVACFFVGENTSLAIAVWEARDGSSREILESPVNKFLVQVDKQNRIRMNDVLRDFGRRIAIDCPPNRFWSSEHKTRILESCAGNSTLIRGIMAVTRKLVADSRRYKYPECCSFYQLPFEQRMAPASTIQLQLLLVQGKCFNGDFPNLTCLLWVRCFGFQDRNFPSCLSLTNLRVLELYGATRIQELWETHPPEDLREMIVTASEGDVFYRFPSRIADLKDLTKIALISNHGEGFRFKKLPDDFCHLESLEHLELCHCKSLSTLPDGFGKLRNLRHLDLCSCQGLWKLPDSFEELLDLEYLDLSDCVELNPKPDIMVSTRKLKTLYISGCPKLQVLPVELQSRSP